MFDFGLTEIFLIAVVALLVIGPKEIPNVMYGAGRLLRRLQYMRFALTKQFDDFMDEADLKKKTDEKRQKEGEK